MRKKISPPNPLQNLKTAKGSFFPLNYDPIKAVLHVVWAESASPMNKAAKYHIALYYKINKSDSKNERETIA